MTEAEWLDKSSSYVVEAASEPQMKVKLEPEDVSENYFLASYRESNVKISGGTFVSARRDGDALLVTLRVRPVKGDFDPPKDAYWNEKIWGKPGGPHRITIPAAMNCSFCGMTRMCTR